MSKYARDLLNKNESAVVIFTRGEKFMKSDSEEKGYSGNWLIRRDHFDRVIIYHRPNELSAGAEIYIGNFDRIDQAIEPETPENRIALLSIHFTNLMSAGKTDVNFHQFTGNMKNNFCFIN